MTRPHSSDRVDSTSDPASIGCDSSPSLAVSSAGEVFVAGIDLWQWRQTARSLAATHNVPPEEVDWLLQDVAGLDRLALRLELFKASPDIRLRYSLAELTDLWQRRIDARVPVQYLVGTAPWRQFSLTVSPAVLIPRPETECLIDLAIAASHRSPNPNLHPEQGDWADLGTGSGAISLGLAFAFPKARIHAVDQSGEALAIAQQNQQQAGLSNRIQFYQGSWFEPLAHLNHQLSGIVSNPPYIPSQQIPTLQPEVAWHEPHLALDGGIDGLDSIRQLVAIAPDYLQSGGIWLIEMMAGQAEVVAQLLADQGSYCQIQIHADLAGIDRFALAYRR